MSVRQFRYDPGQPRVPAGAPGGGRWGGGGSATGSPDYGQGHSGSVGDSGASLNSHSLGEDVAVPSRAELEASFDPIPETPTVENTLLWNLGPDGELTPERKLIHNELISDALHNPETGEPRPKSEKKMALVMGGGAASGKTSAINAGHVDSPPDAVTVNPDEFKIALPESKGPSKDGKQGNGLADEYVTAWAGITHEESSHLGKRLTTAAIDRETNILIDKTSSDGPKAVKEIQRLQAAGYDVQVAYVTTNVDTAVNSALERQKKTGRAVAEPVLRAGHNGANEAFLDVVAGTDVKAKLVTTLPANPDGSHKTPVLTAIGDGAGGLVVHNRSAWDEYVARIPSVPAGMKVTFIDDDKTLTASAGVAQGGTMGVMREDRIKVIYGAAIAGKRPDGLNAEESKFYDDIVVDVAKMRKEGIAPDYPINDIFDDTGIVAVTTPRAFKSGQNPS